ncbi:SDR family NAD(P)-dependent oxidoreductase [Streptomyces sp. NPDC059680]|uniref:SDR family NAD(P)-dependent oxidoreductase n=1 Tax=Streptomyces sp. NPDC059680 TaxID=3346904 RepID=UPI0036981DDE
MFARAVRDRYVHVDILLHNVGMSSMGSSGTLEWTTWRRIVDANLDSVFHPTNALLPGMQEIGWGRILVMAQTTFTAAPLTSPPTPPARAD